LTATSTSSQSDRVLRQTVLGSRRTSNYFWAIVTSVGGAGFFLAALSSYLKTNFLPFADPTELIFIPQGIAMGFYGTIALGIALYLWLAVSLDIGGGYNEFDLDSGKARIFRWGFFGKNRRIEIVFDTDKVQSVRVECQEGLNPKRALYLRVKGMRDIPLTRVGQPLALSELENQGARLARFLKVPLEGV